MNALADRIQPEKVNSIFLYANEAHPGEHYPHLTSMEQKFRHAEALRDTLGVQRPIWLDTLDGGCHRHFGSMPNMSWVFNRVGVALYKADWTDAASVASAVDYLLEVRRRRQAGERLAGFRVERLDYRNTDRKRFFAGLERNGPRAVREYKEAF